MLPNRIRELRLARGLTQEKLAELVGVEHPTIHRWETGKTSEPFEKIQILAGALDCHPGEIFAELPAGTKLTKDEQDLLAAYRLLTGDNKARVLDIARALAKGPANADLAEARRGS